MMVRVGREAHLTHGGCVVQGEKERESKEQVLEGEIAAIINAQRKGGVASFFRCSLHFVVLFLACFRCFMHELGCFISSDN